MDLQECPIIAAVRSYEELTMAVNSPVRVIFMLNTNLMEVKKCTKKAKENGKVFYVHIDLTDGIGKDSCGIEYLAKCGVDGIISTRAGMIRAAKERGLMTVQRFFVMDSHAIDSAIGSAVLTMPDMVEIMPGVIPKVIKRVCENLDIPVIAGGLISDKKEIFGALEAGAGGISTAKSALWYV